jgi:small subunit ribosomal protein S12
MPTLHQLLKGTRQEKKFRSKTPAFKGCPQKRGFVVRCDIIKPKKPNSARRRVAKVKLSNKRFLMAYVPGVGQHVQTNFQVLVRGGRAPDLPGVRYHLYRQALDFSAVEDIERKHRRSKFGIKKPVENDDKINDENNA